MLLLSWLLAPSYPRKPDLLSILLLYQLDNYNRSPEKRHRVYLCTKTGTPPFQEEVPGIFNPVILLLPHHSPVWEPNLEMPHVMNNDPLNTSDLQQKNLI